MSYLDLVNKAFPERGKAQIALQGYELNEINEISPNDPCDRLSKELQAATNVLNENYQLGTLEFIKRNHPTLYRATVQAELRMDEAMRQVLQGTGTAEPFYESLQDWEALMRRWIELAPKATEQ